LQQTKGVSPLAQPIRLIRKKHITAMLTATERTFNGIGTSIFPLHLSSLLYLHTAY